MASHNLPGTGTDRGFSRSVLVYVACGAVAWMLYTLVASTIALVIGGVLPAQLEAGGFLVVLFGAMGAFGAREAYVESQYAQDECDECAAACENCRAAAAKADPMSGSVDQLVTCDEYMGEMPVESGDKP